MPRAWPCGYPKKSFKVISLIQSPANPFSFPYSLGGYRNNWEWGVGGAGGDTSGNQVDFRLRLAGRDEVRSDSSSRVFVQNTRTPITTGLCLFKWETS